MLKTICSSREGKLEDRTPAMHFTFESKNGYKITGNKNLLVKRASENSVDVEKGANYADL
jgi:hypothetical protein